VRSRAPTEPPPGACDSPRAHDHPLRCARAPGWRLRGRGRLRRLAQGLAASGAPRGGCWSRICASGACASDTLPVENVRDSQPRGSPPLGGGLASSRRPTEGRGPQEGPFAGCRRRGSRPHRHCGSAPRMAHSGGQSQAERRRGGSGALSSPAPGLRSPVSPPPDRALLRGIAALDRALSELESGETLPEFADLAAGRRPHRLPRRDHS
jgi:hypothetical protein